VPTHYLRNLLTKVPKSAQPWVATLVRTIFDQPATEEVHAQHARVVDSLAAKHPDAAAHLDEARPDLLAFTGFPREIWRQIWSNNPQVIWSPREAVRRVDHEGLRGRVLRGGRGYLPPSSTRIFRRNHACSAGAHARLVA
jgi:transposase-like protein